MKQELKRVAEVLFYLLVFGVSMTLVTSVSRIFINELESKVNPYE